MAQVFLLCLIMADAFLGLAMASENIQHSFYSTTATVSNPPAISPSSSQSLHKAEEPSIRKLGKHQSEAGFSPSEAPKATIGSSNSFDQTASNEEHSSVQEQEIHLKNNHHSIDKSVAGGGVILGGLATTFLVAVFCYIRATGRHKADNEINV